jgi:hypothetical protein
MLLSSESTLESRLSSMRDRVSELRNAREAERRDLVAQKLDQQWRLGCDALRCIESQALVHQVAKQREGQLAEKREQKLRDAAEDEHFSGLWEAERQKKIHREEADSRARDVLNAETSKVLREQILALRAQAERERALEAEAAEFRVRHSVLRFNPITRATISFFAFIPISLLTRC